MAQYKIKWNVKLSNSQLNKMRPGTKSATEVTLSLL